jgi:chemotaxis signal transduction protein
MAEIDVVKKVTVKEDADRKSNTKQFLTFYVGNEVYGIEVRNVREVIEYENV